MNFDVDLSTDSVKCTRGGFYPKDDELLMENETTRDISAENTNGPIIQLGNHYGLSGIP